MDKYKLSAGRVITRTEDDVPVAAIAKHTLRPRETDDFARLVVRHHNRTPGRYAPPQKGG